MWSQEVKLPSRPGPVQWRHFTDHYVMAPWQAEGDNLVRALVRPDGHPVVTVSRNIGSVEAPDLRVVIYADSDLPETTAEWVIGALGAALGLMDDVTEFYDVIVPADRVLAAAAAHGLRGARLRTSPDVFEAVVAGVASQNVHFSRTYQVMDRLTRRFGRPVLYPGGIAYTFPTVEVLAHSTEEDLRSSGLGYRAPVLRALACSTLDDGVDLQRLRQDPDTASIRDALIDLPGIGPFTADLVLSIGFRRASFHLDSYTKTILDVLYGVKPDEIKMKTFVDKQFGRWKHYAMLLLTTDTDRWARSLGIDFPIKSGASYRMPNGQKEPGRRVQRKPGCTRCVVAGSGAEPGRSRRPDSPKTDGPQSSVAVRLISTLPARALETGQPSFASFAASWKESAVMPGTSPRTLNAILVSLQPTSSCSKVATASVSRRVGGCPPVARPCDSAIE